MANASAAAEPTSQGHRDNGVLACGDGGSGKSAIACRVKSARGLRKRHAHATVDEVVTARLAAPPNQ